MDQSWHLLASAALALSACFQPAASEPPAATDATPAALAYVTDDANVLTDADESALSAKLAKLEADMGHQMVVATVPTLNGRDIASYAVDWANARAIGGVEEQDGLLILVAPYQRQARIAVGHGLERQLPDELCQQIMETAMLPHFRKGDYHAGVVDGVDALIAALN